MKYLKKLLKAFLFTIGSMLILTFIFTCLNYFGIISNKIMMVFKVIIPIFSLALGGFILGKDANKRGYLEGLKLGLIITILILIGNLIFHQNINIKDFVFYLSLIISSMFGSMFGINSKKE